MAGSVASEAAMCKTIKQKVKFKAAPKEVYEALTDSKKHSAFSGERAKISKKIGGPFTAYSNYISGVNVDLSPGKRIVQAWRNNKFPEGIYSMAAFTLVGTRDGGTELTLIHRGVPKVLIPGIERGWRKFYWDKMREYLRKS